MEEPTAIGYFNDAVANEHQFNFTKAIELYEEAAALYLETEHEKVLVLKCVANITICRIRASSFVTLKSTQNDEIREDSATECLEEMLIEIERLYKNHFQKDNEKLAFHKFAIAIYRELESFLLNQGLKDDANSMYIEYKKLDRERMRFFRKYAWWKSLSFKIGSIWKETLNYLDYIFLGYGVRARNLFWLTFGVWLFCGLLYRFGEMVLYNNRSEPVRNICECLYFSTVTLTSIGSEVLVPNAANGGRFVESIEGISGLFIFGMLVSFFSRRIR